MQSTDDSVFTDAPRSTTTMESRLSFRLADPSDAELLGRLNSQLILDEGHRNPMSEPELADRMRKWLRSGEYQVTRFPGLRPFTGAVGSSDQQVIDMIHRLVPLFPGNIISVICSLRFLQG